MNQFKKLVYRVYLFYFLYFPIKVGRSKLGVLLLKIFGRATYETNGIKLKLYPLNLIDQNIILGKQHDTFVSDYIFKTFGNGQKGVFVDIGANMGIFSIEASKYPNVQIYAFEPSQRELSVFYENLKINKTNNVIVYPCGLSNSEEILELNLSQVHNTGMNSFVNLKDFNIYTEKSQIRTYTFDSLFSNEILGRIRLIKIDVEGFEINVLKGMVNALSLINNCSLIIEISRNYLKMNNETPLEIYNLLESNGFIPVFGIKDLDQYDEVFEKKVM